MPNCSLICSGSYVSEGIQTITCADDSAFALQRSVARAVITGWLASEAPVVRRTVRDSPLPKKP